MSNPGLTLMSIREYADTQKVSDTAIRKARKSGRLTEKCFKMEGDKVKGIYKELADLDWLNNMNPAHVRKIKGSSTDKGKDQTNVSNLGGGADLTGFNKSRKLREDINVQLDAIRLKEKQGILIQKSKVFDALFEFGTVIRMELQDIPDNYIDQILGAPSREEAYTVLATAIDQVLHKLTDVNRSIQL